MRVVVEGVGAPSEVQLPLAAGGASEKSPSSEIGSVAACARLVSPADFVPAYHGNRMLKLEQLLEGVEGQRDWRAVENRPPGDISGREAVCLSPSPDVAEYYASQKKRNLHSGNRAVGVVQIWLPASVLRSAAELVGEKWKKVRMGAPDSRL